MLARGAVTLDEGINTDNIESIYQKFLRDILHLFKTDPTTPLYGLLAKDLVTFLHCLDQPKKVQFIVKKTHLLNRLKPYKELPTVKDNTEMMITINQVESDLNQEAKVLKEKLFDQGDNSFFNQFIFTIDSINADERFDSLVTPAMLCNTGEVLNTTKSPGEIITEKLAKSIDQAGPANHFSLQLSNAGCLQQLAQQNFINQKYAQGIVEGYKALNVLKAIDSKYHQNEQYKTTLYRSQLLLIMILDTLVRKEFAEKKYESIIPNVELEIDVIDEIANENKDEPTQTRLIDCYLTLARIYYLQADEKNEDVYDEKIALYTKAIEATNTAIEYSSAYGKSLEEINVKYESLIELHYKCSNVASDIEDYPIAIKNARQAVALCHSLKIEEEILAEYTSHLSMIERDFFSALNRTVIEQVDEDFKIPADENAPENKKRKTSPYFNTYRAKRQKLLNENAVIIADILSKPTEVLHIIDDMDFEDPADFVDFYQSHDNYAILKNQVEKSFDASNSEELTCYCLPFLFGDINKITNDILALLLSPSASQKLSHNIINSFRLIEYAFHYQQSSDQTEKQSIGRNIQQLLTSSANHTLGKAYENFNLSHANLTGIHLPEMNLEFAYLNGIVLSNAELTNANLANTKLLNAHFTNASLRSASLSGSQLRGSQFINANLCGANLSYAGCRGCDFTNANLANSILIGTDFANAKLDNANLTGAQFLPKNVYSNGGFAKKLFYVLDDFKDHPQKELLIIALIEDVLKNVTCAEFSAVLKDYLANYKTNNSFTLFRCKTVVKEVLEKLISYQTSQPVITQPNDPKQSHSPH